MKAKEPYQAHSDSDSELREKAIDLYILGERPSAVARQLGRSRTWFYQVLERYKTGGRPALASRSRAPKRVHNRTPEEVEDAVERIRKAITSGEDPLLRYANIGAETLAIELRRAGLPPPSRATINRILVRRHLVQPRPPKKRKVKLPEDYPWPLVRWPNQMHLLDFVIRSLTGGQRFFGYHLLDHTRRWPVLDAQLTRKVAPVCQFLVIAWQQIGLPMALYIDNDLVWRGSGSGKRTISRVVRLCLFSGVEVIFIPPYTPEANPIMESFNSLWERNFWQRNSFQDLPHVLSELVYFQEYCRTRRPLAEYDQRTADQLFPQFEPFYLPTEFSLHLEAKLPLTAGKIHFIRFVTAEGTFSLLNENWQLDPQPWAGKTIRATLDTGQQVLHVYHQAKPSETCREIACFPYQLREEAVPLQEQFQREHPDLWQVEAREQNCQLCAETLFACKGTEKV